MRTIEQVYDAIIRQANNAGRKGLKLYGYKILHPVSATGSYGFSIDVRPMESATERWDA